MHIHKQSSGGRGEFELVENIGAYGPHDLSGLPILLDCGKYGIRPTYVALRAEKGQGKQRLRRLDGFSNAIHIQRQALAILLLPPSIRDESKLLGGEPVVMLERYIVTHLRIASLVFNEGSVKTVTLKLGELEFNNGGNNAQVNFSDRLDRIASVHDNASKLPPIIRQHVEAHKEFLLTDKPFTKKEEDITRLLMRFCEDMASDYDFDYAFGCDVLPILEGMISPVPAQQPDQPLPIPIDQIADEELGLRRREVNRWRRFAASRGSQGVVFRAKVQTAYKQTCIACGMCLPKGPDCPIPGVDAAHILPWRDYELDDIRNALCLCKLHHWAFDQGIISIRGDEDGIYRIEVTNTAKKALANAPESLAELRKLEGTIPRKRLPDKSTEWPDPSLLERLYEAISPDLSSGVDDENDEESDEGDDG